MFLTVTQSPYLSVPWERRGMMGLQKVRRTGL